MDKLQRLWSTNDGKPQAIDYGASMGRRAISIPPVGFSPTIYMVEDNGVAWVSDRRRLARIDLRLPSPPEVPLRAIITSVQFSASGRQQFAPLRRLNLWPTAITRLDSTSLRLPIHSPTR